MLRRFLLGGFALTALAGTGAVAIRGHETKAGTGTFDYSALTVQDEIAQSQPIAAEEKAPGVDADSAAGPDQEALAKAAQNPIASMISIPFQWNATPGTQWAPNSQHPDAKHDRVMNVVNVQPVFPFKLSDDWTLVTRTIVPFINAPFAKKSLISPLQANRTLMVGVRNTLLGLVMSIPLGFSCPRWRVISPLVLALPSVFLPTRSAEHRQVDCRPCVCWCLHQRPLGRGWLGQQHVVFAGEEDRKDVNKMLIQPFINYNLPPKGWYISVSPIITADWENGQRMDGPCWGRCWTGVHPGQAADQCFIACLLQRH